MHGFMQSRHWLFLLPAVDHLIKQCNRRLRISQHDALTIFMKIASKRCSDWWLQSSPLKETQNSIVVRVIPRKGGGGLLGIGKGICMHEIVAAKANRWVRQTCGKKFYSSQNSFWTDLILPFSFLYTFVLEVKICPLCRAIFWNCRLQLNG